MLAGRLLEFLAVFYQVRIGEALLENLVFLDNLIEFLKHGAEAPSPPGAG